MPRRNGNGALRFGMPRIETDARSDSGREETRAIARAARFARAYIEREGKRERAWRESGCDDAQRRDSVRDDRNSLRETKHRERERERRREREKEEERGGGERGGGGGRRRRRDRRTHDECVRMRDAAHTLDTTVTARHVSEEDEEEEEEEEEERERSKERGGRRRRRRRRRRSKRVSA